MSAHQRNRNRNPRTATVTATAAAITVTVTAGLDDFSRRGEASREPRGREGKPLAVDGSLRPSLPPLPLGPPPVCTNNIVCTL